MLVVFEGIDGSGKNTQAKALEARIAKERQAAVPNHIVNFRDTVFFSFPDYTESHLGPKIRHYLKGGMGKIYDNNPMLVSLLFAVERYEKRCDIYSALLDDKTVICDRYVPSNLAHQAAKIYDPESADWRHLISDIAHVEYKLLTLPEPDLVFYLDLTAEQSYSRTHARDTAPDLHQDDLRYLRNTREVYLHLASRDYCWNIIPCFTESGAPRTIDDIHEQIFTIFAANQAPSIKQASNYAWLGDINVGHAG